MVFEREIRTGRSIHYVPGFVQIGIGNGRGGPDEEAGLPGDMNSVYTERIRTRSTRRFRYSSIESGFFACFQTKKGEYAHHGSSF